MKTRERRDNIYYKKIKSKNPRVAYDTGVLVSALRGIEMYFYGSRMYQMSEGSLSEGEPMMVSQRVLILPAGVTAEVNVGQIVF